jgi:hypothetical protein
MSAVVCDVCGEYLDRPSREHPGACGPEHFDQLRRQAERPPRKCLSSSCRYLVRPPASHCPTHAVHRHQRTGR